MRFPGFFVLFFFLNSAQNNLTRVCFINLFLNFSTEGSKPVEVQNSYLRFIIA